MRSNLELIDIVWNLQEVDRLGDYPHSTVATNLDRKYEVLLSLAKDFDSNQG